MTSFRRPLFPVLNSAGPHSGMLAFSFEGTQAAIDMTLSSTPLPLQKHAGQLAVQHFLKKFGWQDHVQVLCSLSEQEASLPQWKIPLAVQSLLALRQNISGFHQSLEATDILNILKETDIAHPIQDGHKVRAALEGGIHVRVDRDGGAIAFDTPEAAMIWIEIPSIIPSKVWKQSADNPVPRKRAAGAAERLAATLLRAACHDDIAILEAFEAVDVDPALYAAIPGALPAIQAAKGSAPNAFITLEGQGPHLLVFADSEDAASRATMAAIQTFQAHAIDTKVHAWSTILEQS